VLLGDEISGSTTNGGPGEKGAAQGKTRETPGHLSHALRHFRRTLEDLLGGVDLITQS
jgi:hypothetical protein